MHATVPSGGRSPKTMNGPTLTSQLKPGSDGGRSAPSSISLLGKGKKRERSDHGLEPVKRERSIKIDDADSGLSKSESSWKSEIAKFTENGGLVDLEGLEKLVQLMLPDRNERKIDLVGRSMLAGVVAATDKFDCLNGFVLRGLPVFDEWLQEVHKGKIGDGSGSKDNDKPIDEFLLVVLRALDKLPVNLHALQMCNIGKSVNHLRTHKNVEIQKKARSLVDTWKKRVEAEIDAKASSNQAVSWPAARSRLSDVSHGGSRHSSVTSGAATKSSVVQLSASITAPAKLIQGETFLKTASASPVSTKSAVLPVPISDNTKEGHVQNAAGSAPGVSDIPATCMKEEKSSSSSQSQNNSQSCSGDHTKTGKADTRSSTAVSMNASKAIGGSSRHRKSVNGYSGSNHSGDLRETESSRSSLLHRNPASEKASHFSLLSDWTTDVPVAEGKNQKLIVKIPSRGRSPAQSASGGSMVEDLVMNTRASSPALSEKHDQSEHDLKEKDDADRDNIADVNNESWQSDDLREVLNGSDDGDGSASPATLPDDGNSTGDDDRKLAEASKAPLSSFDDENKSRKLHDASFGSINALIESCVKYSEANASMSAGDDLGMNLLASVAAGEMSKCDGNSPTVSPRRSTPVFEHSCTASVSRVKSPACGEFSQNQSQPVDGTHGENSSAACMRQTVERCSPGDVEIEETLATGPSPASIADKTSNYEREQRQAFYTGKDAKVIEGSLSHSCSQTESGNIGKVKDNSNITGQLDQKSLPLHPDFSKGTEAELVSVMDTVPDNVDEVKLEKADETDGRSQSTDKQKCKKETASESAFYNCKGEYAEETSNINEVVSASRTASPAALLQESEKQLNSRGSKFTAIEADESEECTSAAADASLSVAKGSDVEARMVFDLNEGFDADDGNNLRGPGSSSVQLISPLPVPLSSVSTSLPASITVAAAAKRPFVPPEDLLKNRGEFGWKGSAATSAFRPAEPRKILEGQVSEAVTAKPRRAPLDIDLNVPDEEILEDSVYRTSNQSASGISNHKSNSEAVQNAHGVGRFDLDLNRLDDPAEIGNHLMSNGHRMDAQPVKLASGGLCNGEVSTHRDFDLNDGPRIDEVRAEPSPFVLHASAISQPSASGRRVKNSEFGNLSSWFTQGNPYQNVTAQSVLPDRRDHSFPMVASAGPQRMSTPPSGSTPFSADVYRGAVLSSSPALAFPSTPYQYPVFPFGTNFPITSATFPGGPTTYVDSASGGRLCFPAVHSQVLAPAGALPSHFPRPGSYIVDLPDGNNNVGADSSGKWGRQGLDLNAGPVVPDTEGRDEVSSLVSRQLSVAGSQALAEQTRIYQVAGGCALKGKETEGGREGYKQSSRQ